LLLFLFGLISVLGLLMALGTVVARNLVHAALFLVAFFFLVACQFVLLEAEFMAAIQVLVYIGAVAILLLFGIMLTRNIQGDETTGGRWFSKIPAAAAAIGVLVILFVGIARESGTVQRPAWSSQRERPQLAPASPDAPPPPKLAAINNMGKTVGEEMMTRFGLAFEVAGLLLTAALVGAVALAQGEETEAPVRRGAIRTVRAGVASGDSGPQSQALTTSSAPR
jgi:NADH-quinone oxidoreductase subunit J